VLSLRSVSAVELNDDLGSLLLRRPGGIPLRPQQSFLLGSYAEDLRHQLGWERLSKAMFDLRACWPMIKVFHHGEPARIASYTTDRVYGRDVVKGLIDMDGLDAHFGRGATIVCQGVEQYFEPLTTLAQSIGSRAGVRCTANIYVAPPQSGGLRPHRDDHDVIILQVMGSKQWAVGTDQQIVDRNEHADVSEPAARFTLEEGDSCYLPSGYPHVARTIDSVSVHVSLGLRRT